MLRLAAREEQMAGARHDARVAVRQRRQGLVPEQAYRLILGRVEELAGSFARGLRLVSTAIGPVVVLLDTCELISGSQEYLRQAMRKSGSRVHPRAGCQAEGGPGCPHRPLLP
jgi:hypothetical protein